jgi:hypothetical protein
MSFYFLEPVPHACPLFWAYPFDQIDQKVLLDCILATHYDAELGVVKDILEWELDLIADDDRNTVADYGIKEAVGGWSVACNVETELGSPHPLRC